MLSLRLPITKTCAFAGVARADPGEGRAEAPGGQDPRQGQDGRRPQRLPGLARDRRCPQARSPDHSMLLLILNHRKEGSNIVGHPPQNSICNLMFLMHDTAMA